MFLFLMVQFQAVAYLPLGQIDHGSPLAKKNLFDIVKKFGPPFWNPKYATGFRPSVICSVANLKDASYK